MSSPRKLTRGEATHLTTTIHRDHQYLTVHIHQAIDNYRRYARDGYPGGGGNQPGNSHTDPTAATVIGGPDIVEQRYRDLTSSLRAAAAALHRAQLAIQWFTTHNPTEKPTPSCRLAERIVFKHRGPDGRTLTQAGYEPVYADGLSRWAYDFRTRYGEEPHLELVRWHLEHHSEKIPHWLVRQQHPDAWARLHTRRGRLATA